MKRTATLAIGLFMTAAPLLANCGKNRTYSSGNFTISNANNICSALELDSLK